MTNKGADQTARLRRLICTFVVRIWQKQVFSWQGSFFMHTGWLYLKSPENWDTCRSNNPKIWKKWVYHTKMCPKLKRSERNGSADPESDCLLSMVTYCKFPKYLDTQKICCNHSKIWTMWLYHRVMSPNDAGGMANRVDPDQTAQEQSDQQSDLGLHCLPRHICLKT